MQERISRWARQHGPAIVLAAARDRIERGRVGAAPLAVDLDPTQRGQVGQLLGLDWQVSGRGPTLKGLRSALAEHDVALEALLEFLGGPLIDRRAVRAAARAERADELNASRALLASVLPPDLVDEVVATCLPSRSPRAQAEKLARVAGRLPAEVYLPVLAAECFGDSHALDRNRSLGRAAARMAALLSGRSPLSRDFGAEQWRDAWAAAGVSCDRVSTMVLILNVALTGAPEVAAVTGITGEPVWLTARLLDRAELPVPLPARVFVCENPSIVESAADRLGARCAPLICTFGIPSQAALTLLRRLDTAGVRLSVRADNDHAGQAIVRTVRSAAPGSDLWRYGPDAPTYEEQLVAELLADLSVEHDRSGPSPS